MDQFARRRQEFFAPYEGRLRHLHDLHPDLDRGARLSETLDGSIDPYLGRVVQLGRLIGLELTLRAAAKDRTNPGTMSGSAPSSSPEQRVAAIVRALTAHREARGIQKQAFGLVIGRTAHDITRFDSGRLRYNLGFVLEYAEVLDLDLVFVDPAIESVELLGIEDLNPDLPFDPAPEIHITSKRKRKGRYRHGSPGALAGLREMQALRDQFLNPVRAAVAGATEADRAALGALLPKRLLNGARSDRDSPLAALCTMLSATGHVPILVPSNAVADYSSSAPAKRPDLLVDHEGRGREMAWTIVRQLEEIRDVAGCDKQDLTRLTGHRLYVFDTPDGPLPRLSSVIRIADVFDLRLLSVPADFPSAGSVPLRRRPRVQPSRLHAPYKLRHVADDASRASKLAEGREAIAERVEVTAKRRTEEASSRKAEAARLEEVREMRRSRRASMTPAELAESERISRSRKEQRIVRKALATQRKMPLTSPARAAMVPSIESRRGVSAGSTAQELATADAIRDLRVRLGEFGCEIRQRHPPFAAFLAATTRTGQSVALKAGRRTALLRTRRPASEFVAEWNAFLDGVLRPLDAKTDPTGALIDGVRRLSPGVTLTLVLQCLHRSGIRLMLI
jgi:hypothetical protein